MAFVAMLTVLHVFYTNGEQLDSSVTGKQMDSIIAAWGQQFSTKNLESKEKGSFPA